MYCSGKFNTRKWQDNDGNDRYSTGIKLVDMQMLDSRGSADNQGSSNATQSQPAASDDFDDDIPFR